MILAIALYALVIVSGIAVVRPVEVLSSGRPRYVTVIASLLVMEVLGYLLVIRIADAVSSLRQIFEFGVSIIFPLAVAWGLFTLKRWTMILAGIWALYLTVQSISVIVSLGGAHHGAGMALLLFMILVNGPAMPGLIFVYARKLYIHKLMGA